jgi:hypothetical protein
MVLAFAWATFVLLVMRAGNRQPGSSVHDNKIRQPQISKIWPEKTTFEVQTNHLFGCSGKLFFHGILFRSVPSFGMGSSAEFGIPLEWALFSAE